MKTPDVERVTRKPGEIELNREPRETKKKTMISNSRKKKSEKQRRRERESRARYDCAREIRHNRTVARKQKSIQKTRRISGD
jgi:hypothetical protein